jgi:hypothetical protein
MSSKAKLAAIGALCLTVGVVLWLRIGAWKGGTRAEVVDPARDEVDENRQNAEATSDGQATAVQLRTEHLHPGARGGEDRKKAARSQAKSPMASDVPEPFNDPGWFEAMKRCDEPVDMVSIAPTERAARVSSDGFAMYRHPSVDMRVRNFRDGRPRERFLLIPFDDRWVRDGQATRWTADGTQETCFWKDGLATGLWVCKDRSGVVMRERWYERGELQRETDGEGTALAKEWVRLETRNLDPRQADATIDVEVFARRWRIGWDVSNGWVEVSISQETKDAWTLDATGRDSEEYLGPPAKYRITVVGKEGARGRVWVEHPKSWSER